MTDEPKTETSAATAQVASENVLTKLSLKTMGCTPQSAAVEKKPVPMGRIIGVARGIKEAIGNDGDTVYGLTGNFKGTNIKTGVEYTSGVCYLPGGIQEMVLDPLDAMLAEPDAKGSSLNFAFDIFATPADNKAGYSYTAVNLAPATRTDPFAEVMAAIEGKELPRLEAPAADKK